MNVFKGTRRHYGMKGLHCAKLLVSEGTRIGNRAIDAPCEGKFRPIKETMREPPRRETWPRQW